MILYAHIHIILMAIHTLPIQLQLCTQPSFVVSMSSTIDYNPYTYFFIILDTICISWGHHNSKYKALPYSHTYKYVLCIMFMQVHVNKAHVYTLSETTMHALCKITKCIKITSRNYSFAIDHFQGISINFPIIFTHRNCYDYFAIIHYKNIIIIKLLLLNYFKNNTI